MLKKVLIITLLINSLFYVACTQEKEDAYVFGEVSLNEFSAQRAPNQEADEQDIFEQEQSVDQKDNTNLNRQQSSQLQDICENKENENPCFVLLIDENNNMGSKQ